MKADESFDAFIHDLAGYWHDLVNEGMNEHEASRVADMSLCAEIIRRRKAKRGEPATASYEEVMEMMETL